MEIRRQGSAIILKGKKENVLINPDKELVKNGKISSRIIAFSDIKDDFLGYKNGAVVMKGPGEYEVGGVEIVGISGGTGKTLYVFTIDGVKIIVVGSLSEELSEKRIEKVGEADVLVASIRDDSKVSFKKIQEWAKLWGVNYLVPVDYEETEGMLAKFLDVLDREGTEGVDSLKVDGETLPEGKEVVIINN